MSPDDTPYETSIRHLARAIWHQARGEGELAAHHGSETIREMRLTAMGETDLWSWLPLVADVGARNPTSELPDLITEWVGSSRTATPRRRAYGAAALARFALARSPGDPGVGRHLQAAAHLLADFGSRGEAARVRGDLSRWLAARGDHTDALVQRDLAVRELAALAAPGWSADV